MIELAGHAFTVADGNVLRCECGWRRPLARGGRSSQHRAAAINYAIWQHETEVTHGERSDDDGRRRPAS